MVEAYDTADVVVVQAHLVEDEADGCIGGI